VLLRAAREEKLSVKVARIGPVYGAGFNFTMDGPIRAGRAWLPGEGLNYVSVVHADDCVRALLAIDERGQGGEIYHVAGRTTPLMKEFYAEVHKRVGGKPVRFWSTWIPSVFQFQLAALNERVKVAMGRRPRFTPDNLRLIPSGVRLKVDRLEKELGFEWLYPDHQAGLDAVFPKP
jgi:nucleoside-diphosphate-sugar epimerase